MTPILSIEQLTFSWPGASQPVLRLPQLTVAPAERVFVRGPSGCGKSTLLSLIAGIHRPSSGNLSLLGTQLDSLSSVKRDHFRANHIGYIFQMFNLLPYLSVIDNVILPCHFSANRRRRALVQSPTLEAEARRLLGHLELPPSLMHSAPPALSIGQQQRVAAARALIGSPELLIADEPTSALDTDTRAAFIELLFKECRLSEMTLLFVSHDPTLAAYFDRCLDLPELNQAGGH